MTKNIYVLKEKKDFIILNKIEYLESLSLSEQGKIISSSMKIQLRRGNESANI